MINENIKAIRKSKELSQQELAVKLNGLRPLLTDSPGLHNPQFDLL